jgi:2',3'-cyclic-nucleotide 2'-phosphodiesterase (5'-nucleotidase family)
MSHAIPHSHLRVFLLFLLVESTVSVSSAQAPLTATPSSKPASDLQSPVQILFTGKLMGYMRLPDEQDSAAPASQQICPTDDAHGSVSDKASPDGREFLNALQTDAYKKKFNTVLLGMGDNFSPELLARVFHPMPPLPPNALQLLRANLAGKDLYVWDWAHTNNLGLPDPKWIFADSRDVSQAAGAQLSAGRGYIPVDNVGCFLAVAEYDAVVPGKHDFYFGPERLRHLARFLATPSEGHPYAVQMLATNLVIETKYTPPKKILTDAARRVGYATSDDNLKPVDFSDGKHILPWVRKFRFEAKVQEPGLTACLYLAVTGDPSKLQIPCSHPLIPTWRTMTLGGSPKVYLDLAISNPALLDPGASYAVCIPRPGHPNYCTRINVDHPFFLYPNARPAQAGPGQAYADPEPYLWKCLADERGNPPLATDLVKGDCTTGHREVAIFGVLDQDLAEHIGQLNDAWLNDTALRSYETQLNVMDPAEALEQLLQKFQAEHPNFRGVKVLLAQISAPRAQQLIARLNGEFHVVIAEPQVEQATPNEIIQLDGPPIDAPGDEKRPPSLVVVPPPYYDPKENKPVLWLRKLDVTKIGDTQTHSQWSFILTGDRQAGAQYADRVETQNWLQDAVYTARHHLLPNEPHLVAGLTPIPVFERVFREYVLRVMKETAHADIALLQKRDFFFDARLSNYYVAHPDVAQAINRLLWKGDFIIKRTLPGSSLKAALKRSKDFDKQDVSSTSLELERNRGLVLLGITTDAEREQYLVNGEPLDEGKLYTVATSDYIGLGDTGYPELVSGAVGGPTLPRDFGYVCPVYLAVEYATHAPDGDYDDPRCGKVLAAKNYFDHLADTPIDTRTDSYIQKLERWVGVNRLSAPDPWSAMLPMERQSQLRPEWFLSLSKATASMNAIRNSVDETSKQSQFAGVTVPQVQAAKSSNISIANQASSGISSASMDGFISYDLAHTRSSIGQASAARKLNFPDNRLVLESGWFYHPWRKRKYARFGPQISVRYETQLFEPLDGLQLKNVSTSPATRSTLTFREQRTRNIQLPRIGFRWQDRESNFQFGYELAHVQRINGYNFADLKTKNFTAFCPVSDPSNPNALSDCLTAGNSANPQTITANSIASAVLTKVIRNGIYFTGKLVVPSTAKVSYVSEHDFELIFPGSPIGKDRDVASMTYWHYLTTQSVRFKIFDNFTVSPTLQIFMFQNQSAGNAANQHFFKQLKSSIDLNYTFDWFRGNSGRALRYKKPQK